MGDDDTGSGWLAWQPTQDVVQTREVMPVHLGYRPTGRTPFISQRLQIKHRFHGPKALDLVVINDHSQVIQLEMRGEQDWLPVGTLIEFAITQQDEYAIDPPVPLRRKRNAGTN